MVSDTSAGVRLAVRAGLQFACNYCVGSEENKALLWDAWFPRGLMVRNFALMRLMAAPFRGFRRRTFGAGGWGSFWAFS